MCRPALLARGTLVLTTACVRNVQISQPDIPAAFIQPLPVSAAVIYDDSLRNFRHEQPYWGDPFVFEPGPAIIAIFDTVFTDNFLEVHLLGSDPNFYTRFPGREFIGHTAPSD
jgi:hypothetical protein